MINSLTYENALKLIRKMIIEQTGLSDKHVLNAMSVRGANLSKIIEDASSSINLDDSFIVFEMKENINSDNFVTTEEDESFSIIQGYEFFMHIYGNHSHTISQLIIARLRSEEIVDSLRESGIKITGFDGPDTIEEFVNNTFLQRRDMTLYFKVRHSFNAKSNSGYINEESNTEPTVIKLG